MARVVKENVFTSEGKEIVELFQVKLMISTSGEFLRGTRLFTGRRRPHLPGLPALIPFSLLLVLIKRWCFEGLSSTTVCPLCPSRRVDRLVRGGAGGVDRLLVSVSGASRRTITPQCAGTR